jgi:hypothetical protein
MSSAGRVVDFPQAEIVARSGREVGFQVLAVDGANAGEEGGPEGRRCQAEIDVPLKSELVQIDCRSGCIGSARGGGGMSRPDPDDRGVAGVGGGEGVAGARRPDVVGSDFAEQAVSVGLGA